MNVNKLSLIVIAVLIGIIILQRACSKPYPCPDGGKPQVVTVIDTQYITNVVEKPVYKPGKVKYLPGEEIPVFIPIDTAAILKDYYATRVYNDTVAIDSIGYAYIEDSVSKNEIQARRFSARYTVPVIKETTTITIPPKPKTQLYIGIEAGGSKINPINYFGPALVLKTKKDQMYSAGLGYTVDQGFGVKAGILWKIKIK